MDTIGVGSLAIAAITGFFAGAVMALQMSAPGPVRQVGKTGTLVSVTWLRAAVLTALMVAGRNASGLQANWVP